MARAKTVLVIEPLESKLWDQAKPTERAMAKVAAVCSKQEEKRYCCRHKKEVPLASTVKRCILTLCGAGGTDGEEQHSLPSTKPTAPTADGKGEAGRKPNQGSLTWLKRSSAGPRLAGHVVRVRRSAGWPCRSGPSRMVGCGVADGEQSGGPCALSWEALARTYGVGVGVRGGEGGGRGGEVRRAGGVRGGVGVSQ